MSGVSIPMLERSLQNRVLASLPLYHSFGYICIEACDTLNGLTTVHTSMKPKPDEVRDGDCIQTSTL